jgi:molybdate transport system ATP-binding protein
MARLDLHPLTGRFEAGALLETRIVAHDDRYGLTRLGCAAGVISVARLAEPVGAPVRLRIRARDVLIATEDLGDRISARNILAARLGEIAVMPGGGDGEGPLARVRLVLEDGQVLLAHVTRRAIDALELRPGRRVHALVKTVALDRHSLGRSAPPD